MNGEKLWFNNKEITLSLTGKDSHKALIEAGQGSFSIGTKNISEEDFDVLVNENDVINWDTFNEFYTPYCYYECKDKYPYGDWPRFFYYCGNDTGFINWSLKRVIEDFSWFPNKDMKVDFTKARIGRLQFGIKNSRLELSLGENIYELHLKGNLDNYNIKKCKRIPRIYFEPEYDNELTSYKLPNFKVFKKATHIEIRTSALKPPFDCSSLLQFHNLKELYLIGNITNLEVLKDLKNIEKLGIWGAPDLTDMPNLNSWKNLNWFVALNIDEKAGKKFRKEIKVLKKEKKFEFVSVSQLRDKLWFETNYGIPFSEWDRKNEKKATSAYKICLEKVKSSTTKKEIEKAIKDFVEKINKLDNIETVERDDTYTAINLIMKKSPLKVETKEWEHWFDEVREF